MFVKTLPLQWYQKSWNFFWWGWGVQVDKNHGFPGYFEVQTTFLPASTHQTCRKRLFGCFTTSHQIARQNTDRKILFVKKSKYFMWKNQKGSSFSVFRRSAKRKNRIGKAKRDAGNLFLDFLFTFAKNLVRQTHKYGFFSKVSNVKVCFCHSHSIPCCLVHPGMFSLAL